MKCQFCSFAASETDVVTHVIRTHNGHPLFSVSCKLCGGTWKKYDSFKRHVFRKHRGSGLVPWPCGSNSDNSEEMSVDQTDNVTDSVELYEKQLTEESAVFVLRLKAMHGVSQSCVNDVIMHCNSLIKTACTVACESVVTSCSADRPSRSTLRQEFASVGVTAFQGLETEWKQSKYFREVFGMIEPVAVPMGQRVVIKHGAGDVTSVPVYGYFVPFLDNLKQLLQLPELRSVVLSDQVTAGSVLHDFKDGEFCRQHPIFSRRSIKILGYFDDVEVVNPIGAHTKKHKLSLFFWTLLNIPAIYRARLSCINLIAVARTKDCRKFGIAALLQDFICGINTLYCEGIEVEDGLGTTVIQGGLVAFAGDTLASNFIGGFKEGVGFAKRICRTCETTASQSKWLYCDRDCDIRQLDEHRRRCERLQTSLTTKARKYWSRMYGINGSSVLLDVKGFSVTVGLIHDPMHILFEGITALEMKLLLRHLLLGSPSYFTISQLNCAIDALCEKVPSDCLPNPVEIKQVQSADKLRQTATQIRWLSHLLPLAVGDKVPADDERWCNYIRLLQIQQMCTSPVATESTMFSLEVTVARHNKSFHTLYPEFASIPKLHYLVHLPQQIRRFGPARNHWCMRMEAKNAFFKRKKLRNTKNVPKSVSFDHQMWSCCMQRDNSGQPNSRFLRLPPSSVKGICYCADTYEHVNFVKQHFEVSAGDSLLSTPEATVFGITYKLKDVVLLGCIGEMSFAQIIDIIVWNEQLLCIGLELAVDFFDVHINCYVVSLTTKLCSFEPSKLLLPWPVYHTQSADKLFLLPFSLCDVEELV